MFFTRKKVATLLKVLPPWLLMIQLFIFSLNPACFPIRFEPTRGRLHGLTGSAVGHIYIAPQFKSGPSYFRRVRHFSLRYITFGGCSAHLAYIIHKIGEPWGQNCPICLNNRSSVHGGQRKIYGRKKRKAALNYLCIYVLQAAECLIYVINDIREEVENKWIHIYRNK